MKSFETWSTWIYLDDIPEILRFASTTWAYELPILNKSEEPLRTCTEAAKDRKADHATGLAFVVVCPGFPIAFGLGQLSKKKKRLGKQQNCFPLWSGVVSNIVRSSWRATHLVLQHGKTSRFSSIFSVIKKDCYCKYSNWKYCAKNNSTILQMICCFEINPCVQKELAS